MGMANYPAGSRPKLISTTTLVALSVMASLTVSACSWSDERSEQLGAVAGGVVGAILGSKVGGGTGRNASMVIGAALGAMWGQDIAKGLTDVDKIYTERTTQDTLEYGEPGETTTWSNPDSGNSGSVTADEIYTAKDGRDCREFETTVQVEGEQRAATGTACRTSDGEWEIVDEPEQTT